MRDMPTPKSFEAFNLHRINIASWRGVHPVQMHEKLVETAMRQLREDGRELLPMLQDSQVEEKRQSLRSTEGDMQTALLKLQAICTRMVK